MEKRKQDNKTILYRNCGKFHPIKYPLKKLPPWNFSPMKNSPMEKLPSRKFIPPPENVCILPNNRYYAKKNRRIL